MLNVDKPTRRPGTCRLRSIRPTREASCRFDDTFVLAAVEEKAPRGGDVRLCREERRALAARLLFSGYSGRAATNPCRPPLTEVRLCETHVGVSAERFAVIRIPRRAKSEFGPSTPVKTSVLLVTALSVKITSIAPMNLAGSSWPRNEKSLNSLSSARVKMTSVRVAQLQL
jgi:hypothetical protein